MWYPMVMEGKVVAEDLRVGDILRPSESVIIDVEPADSDCPYVRVWVESSVPLCYEPNNLVEVKVKQ